MADKQSLATYRKCYAKLLRFYSRPFRSRFAESMEQTFSDLLLERAKRGEGVLLAALWLFIEAGGGIIKDNVSYIFMNYKNIVRVFLVVGCLLMIPFFGGFNWDGFDYAVAGTLLSGTGIAFVLIARKATTFAYRAAVGIALAAALLLVWINLAVGIIGNESNPANTLFFGVLAAAFVGAVIARLQPLGMSRALVVTAVVQALVPVIAFAIWRPPFSVGVLLVFLFNLVFVGMWATSALLFRRAATHAPIAPAA